jgi:hypothetical protein
MNYRWFDPKTGDWASSGTLQPRVVAELEAPDKNPWILKVANNNGKP